MINFGNNPCTLYLGDRKVTAAYLGDEKVYPNTPALVVSPVAFEFAAAGGSVAMTIECAVDIDWEINNIGGTSHFQFSFSGAQGRQTIGRAAPRLLTGTGPGTITITAPNNASTSAISENDLYIRASGRTDEIYLSLTQAAGEKVYGNWQNISLELDQTSFPNTGGSCNMRVHVRRVWTWNEIPESGDEETSTASLRNAITSDTSVATVSGNVLNVASLANIVKATATLSISAETEYDSNRVSAAFTQNENYISGVNVLLTRGVTFSDIPAAGGSATPTWTQYGLDDLWQMVYATGATSSYYHAYNNGWGVMSDLPAEGEAGYDNQNWTYDGGGNFAGINPDTGVISASSKGTVESGATSTNVRCVLYQKWVNKTGIGPANVYFNGSKGGYVTGSASQAENRRRSTGSSCSGTTLVTYYKWDSGADGGSSSSLNSYDCGYRRTLTIDGIFNNPTGTMRNPSLTVWLANNPDDGPSYSDNPTVYFSEAGDNFEVTATANKAYTNHTPTKAILLLNYEGDYSNIEWLVVSAGSGSVISTSGSLCYMDIGAWDSIGMKQIQIRINVI